MAKLRRHIALWLINRLTDWTRSLHSWGDINEIAIHAILEELTQPGDTARTYKVVGQVAFSDGIALEPRSFVRRAAERGIVFTIDAAGRLCYG